MPHKFHADRRGKIPRQKHRVTNWAEYNESLRRREDLTFWINEDALGFWLAPRRTTRGGQPRYSDLAIELCLTLGVVFRQPLRLPGNKWLEEKHKTKRKRRSWLKLHLGLGLVSGVIVCSD